MSFAWEKVWEEKTVILRQKRSKSKTASALFWFFGYSEGPILDAAPGQWFWRLFMRLYDKLCIKLFNKYSDQPVVQGVFVRNYKENSRFYFTNLTHVKIVHAKHIDQIILTEKRP